ASNQRTVACIAYQIVVHALTSNSDGRSSEMELWVKHRYVPGGRHIRDIQCLAGEEFIEIPRSARKNAGMFVMHPILKKTVVEGLECRMHHRQIQRLMPHGEFDLADKGFRRIDGRVLLKYGSINHQCPPCAGYGFRTYCW